MSNSITPSSTVSTQQNLHHHYYHQSATSSATDSPSPPPLSSLLTFVCRGLFYCAFFTCTYDLLLSSSSYVALTPMSQLSLCSLFDFPEKFSGNSLVVVEICWWLLWLQCGCTWRMHIFQRLVHVCNMMMRFGEQKVAPKPMHFFLHHKHNHLSSVCQHFPVRN